MKGVDARGRGRDHGARDGGPRRSHAIKDPRSARLAQSDVPKLERIASAGGAIASPASTSATARSQNARPRRTAGASRSEDQTSMAPESVRLRRYDLLSEVLTRRYVSTQEIWSID
jgi:hypothetical protein